MDETVKQQIEDILSKDRIMLFMKGTPAEPQCGFSAQVINLLNQCEAKYSSFDIFSDGEIRQGIKEYSNWPTIPQLYVDGKFIGGCDIVTEMHTEGELKELLAEK